MLVLNIILHINSVDSFITTQLMMKFNLKTILVVIITELLCTLIKSQQSKELIIYRSIKLYLSMKLWPQRCTSDAASHKQHGALYSDSDTLHQHTQAKLKVTCQMCISYTDNYNLTKNEERLNSMKVKVFSMLKKNLKKSRKCTHLILITEIFKI